MSRHSASSGGSGRDGAAARSWLDLAVDYFEPVAREVFDSYMQSHRFSRGKANEFGELTFRRGGCFMDVGYNFDERPNLCPQVRIGLVRWFWLRSGFDHISLWYAIPEDREERDYELWRYFNAEELRTVLTRIRDEVVEVYARPLLEDTKKLSALIEQNSREVKAAREREIENEMLRRIREEADRAFRSRDYSKAATLYGQIGVPKLSPVERKRLELSKKYASEGG
jgi:hypothetical protein